MLFIFSLIIASIFALTAKSTIKRHPYPWYIGALALTLFISLFPFSRNLPEAVTFLLDLFRRGALSCALWCIVMWTGAFSNGSWLIKRLMPVRGELSIFAAMLTLGHMEELISCVSLLMHPHFLPINLLPASLQLFFLSL